MNGHVDDAGRALLPLRVRSVAPGIARDLLVWVDTAFDGELVVPHELVADLGLTQTACVQATLADGKNVVLETFDCEIEWFGQWRPVEAIANIGWRPLLGIGLLKGRKFSIDYRVGEPVLE